MSLCQIVPYGGEAKWVKTGLLEYPQTKLLVILANKPEDRDKDLLSEAYTIKSELINERASLPNQYTLAVDVIDFTEFRDDYFSLLSNFIRLFDKVIENGYRIAVNATSGLQVLRIVLYQVSLMRRANVVAFFTFHKHSGQQQIYWLYRELKEAEIDVLHILRGRKEISLTDVFRELQNSNKGFSLSYISKLIQELSNEGLVIGRKESRTRIVSLSNLGEAIFGMYASPDIVSSDDAQQSKNELRTAGHPSSLGPLHG